MSKLKALESERSLAEAKAGFCLCLQAVVISLLKNVFSVGSTVTRSYVSQKRTLTKALKGCLSVAAVFLSKSRTAIVFKS